VSAVREEQGVADVEEDGFQLSCHSLHVDTSGSEMTRVVT
jgi:hypothetical protein